MFIFYFIQILLIKYFCSDIQSLIESFGSHLNVDLQQRGVEFTQLFGSHNQLRPALLEKMPPMQVSRLSAANGGSSSYEENSPDLIENGTIADEQTGKESSISMIGDQSVSEVIRLTYLHKIIKV